MPFSRRQSALFVGVSFLAIAVFWAFSLIQSVQPQFVSGSYTSETGTTVPIRLPFSFNGAPRSMKMALRFSVPSKLPALYHFWFLGCINSLRTSSQN